MKKNTSRFVYLYLILIVVLMPLGRSQTCIPTGYPGAPIDSGCPLRSRTINYTVLWPDQITTYVQNTGTGGCETRWGCPPNTQHYPFNCDADFQTGAGMGFFSVTVTDTLPNCWNLTCVNNTSYDQRICGCYNTGTPRTNTSPHTCSPCPIIIDVSGNGFDLSDNATGVQFDISGFGMPERISWTTQGATNAWLALDRNDNGMIDDGTELFGNSTEQIDSPSPNGFMALAELDLAKKGGNMNGRVDSGDANFCVLRLWRDSNHNGISEPSELSTLASARITGIDLDYRISNRTDRNGNSFRYRAKIYGDDQGKVPRWAWDVFLLTR